MFEGATNFYLANQDFLNGIATALTIVGTFAAFVAFLKQRKKRIYYHWDRVDLTPKQIPNGFDVTFKNQKSEGNGLVFDAVKFSNRSDVTLTEDDFVQPIRFKLKGDRAIYQAEILDTNNGSSGFLTRTDTGFELSKLTIPRNETLSILFSHDSSIEKGFSATLKSLPELKERKFTSASNHDIVSLISMLLSWGIAIGLFALVFSAVSDKENPRLVIMLPLVLALPLVIIFSDSLLPKLIGRPFRHILGISKGEEALSKLSPSLMSEQITKQSVEGQVESNSPMAEGSDQNK